MERAIIAVFVTRRKKVRRRREQCLDFGRRYYFIDLVVLTSLEIKIFAGDYTITIT
jgi:hypothetical protein